MLKVETKKAKIYRQSLISLRFCQTKEEAIKITYQKNRGKKKGKEEVAIKIRKGNWGPN